MPPVTAGDEGRPGGWVPSAPGPTPAPATVAAPTTGPGSDATPDGSTAPSTPPGHEPDTQPVTRASLRAAREAQARDAQTRRRAHLGADPDDGGAGRHTGSPAVLAAAATGVALALLLGVSAYAGSVPTALATAFTAVVMVWGWASLTAAPSPRSATVVTGLGVLAVCATVVLTRTEPYLVWVPAAVAVSVVAAFLHQVFRPGGRPRLTEGIASSVSVLALAACGAPLIALPVESRGARWVAVAMASVAVAAALALGLRRRGGAPWVLGATVVLGTGVAVLAAWLVGGLPLLAAALLGLLVSAVSHSLLRVLLDLPGAASAQAAVAAGAASVLVVGVLVYLVGRVASG